MKAYEPPWHSGRSNGSDVDDENRARKQGRLTAPAVPTAPTFGERVYANLYHVLPVKSTKEA